MYVNEGCTPGPASLSRASTVSELLLSSTSALCKFYPQLQVSTHHPKINTLQLRFVSSCKGDTFFPAQYTFAHYWHDGLMLCRVQRRLRHPCCTTYYGILSINCNCVLFDDYQMVQVVGLRIVSIFQVPFTVVSLSLSNRELIRLSASGIDPRLALCSFRFSSSKSSWIAVLITISSWGTTVCVQFSFFEFFYFMAETSLLGAQAQLKYSEGSQQFLDLVVKDQVAKQSFQHAVSFPACFLMLRRSTVARLAGWTLPGAHN